MQRCSNWVTGIMVIYCVDDTPIHLQKIKQTIEKAFAGRTNLSVWSFCDGGQMLEEVVKQEPVLVTLDINMPALDGLSTLVRLKGMCPTCKVVMVSAESETVVRRLASSNRFTADHATKQEMLGRVVARVRTGRQEKGKINSVLEACATLGMDPVEVARQYGASAFLTKPFEVEDASQRLSRLL